MKVCLVREKTRAGFSKKALFMRAFHKIFPGGVLLSRGPAPRVPSALEDLTAVFGMGTGVSPPRYPPETCVLSKLHSG